MPVAAKFSPDSLPWSFYSQLTELTEGRQALLDARQPFFFMGMPYSGRDKPH